MEQRCKNKEEFLSILLEQVRCKKAHPFIEEEIRGHIEEQIDDNISAGMSKEEAEKAAIADMGSPVETGISLDRIHRPKMEWSMVVLMAVISVIGIAIHYMIMNEMLFTSSFTEMKAGIVAGSSNFAMYTVMGFVIMLVICHIDYTVIAKYAKVLGFVFLAGIFLLSPNMFGNRINGSTVWFAGFGSLRVSIFSFMMLYVPLYGAIIYKYYGTGYKGIVKSVFWMIASLMLAIRLPSLILAAILLVSLGAVLSLAIWNNWFMLKHSSHKKILVGLWGSVIGLPIVSLGAAYTFGWFSGYQLDRVRAFITNSGDANYLTGLFRTQLSSSQLLGNSGIKVAGWIPDFNSSWILVYLSSAYGMIIAVLVCCILAALVIKVFSVALKQKNQLGMVMGCGSGMVFLINFALNVLENIGLFPITQTFLPFFSAGGCDIVVCYMLMGIVLSVYRYKSIYPKYVNTKINCLTTEKRQTQKEAAIAAVSEIGLN